MSTLPVNPPAYSDEFLTVIEGDCLEVMAGMEPNSVDTVITDPPYSYEFMGRAWDRHKDEDAAFGYYLSGLVDGEGHFRVQEQSRGTYSCAFTLKLRKDDAAILEMVRRFLGVGSITSEDRTDANPMMRLAVQAKADCLRVVEVFLRYPLRAKKLRDFLPWAEAVVEWNGMKRGHRWSGRGDWSRLAALKARVESAREYREPPWSGNGCQDFAREWGELALNVLKPGGWAFVFGGPRTHHRVAAGLEDAGFEIRDCVMFLHGQGFPKSLDISKAIDKAAGAEREVVGFTDPTDPRQSGRGGGSGFASKISGVDERAVPLTAPATDAARLWSGWGTALKPAFEIIIVAMKPLDGTFAANAQKWGVAGLNIDAARIEGVKPHREVVKQQTNDWNGGGPWKSSGVGSGESMVGRWPANVALDEIAAQALDEMSGERCGANGGSKHDVGRTHGFMESRISTRNEDWGEPRDALGGASRFFYTAKASRSEREEGLDGVPVGVKRILNNGITSSDHPDTAPGGGDRSARNTHPTVKPLALMEWLCKLTSTPTAGVILDPFMGSGTTLLAARNTGRRCIGIEREPEYVQIACGRLKTWQPTLFDAPEPAPAPEPEDPEWQQPSLAL